MAIKCKWCNKEFTPRSNIGGKQKFCSKNCREEYHSFMDKRSPLYNEKRTRDIVLSNPNLYVKCQICGKLARRKLSKHVKTYHKMSWQEYKDRFPDAEDECKEVKDYSYEYVKRKGIVTKRDDILISWEGIKRRKMKKVGNKCELCGFNKYKESLTAHHIIPKEYGGKDEYNNCIIVCENCHRHIHRLIFDLVKTKKYTIEDIVQTCARAQEVGSKSLR